MWRIGRSSAPTCPCWASCCGAAGRSWWHVKPCWLLTSNQEAGFLCRLVDVAFRPIERAYMSMLGFVLRRRWVVVVACAAVMGSCVPIARALPGSFLPLDDKAKFQVTLRAPEGTST